MQSGANYRLVVRRGPQPNQMYELNRETITIGRDITNDIVINDPEVSRHHARLVQTASGYMVEDLRSTNGTFVNRQQITGPQQLNNGDLLGFGETVLLAYEAVGSPTDKTVASSDISRSEVAQRAQQPLAEPGHVPAATPAPPPPGPMPPPQTFDEGVDDDSDRNRWIVIGCAVLTLVFCCALVGAAIIIDTQQLYCDVPVMRDISFFCAP